MRLTLLILLCGSAFANDLYVNTDTGSGTTCSSGSPCATLSVGVAQLPVPVTAPWTIWVAGAAADTTAVTISGHTTTPANYIEIKTDPTAPNGRHQGVWSTSKYRLVATAGGQIMITLSDLYVRITGLQLSCQGGCSDLYLNTANGPATDIRISNNILVNTIPSTSSYIVSDTSYGTSNTVWNNLIYASGGTGGTGIRFLNTTGSQNKAYNNTIIGFTEGVHKYGTTTLKNNLFSGCTADVGNGAATDTYNATTNDNTKGLSAGGTGNRFSQTFTFAGAAPDYLLGATDAGARTYGATDPGSGLFLDDILGMTRVAPWDIGASQINVSSGRRRVVTVNE
jgi:hypothetical protein